MHPSENEFLNLSEKEKIEEILQKSDNKSNALLEFIEQKNKEKVVSLEQNFSQLFNSTPAGIIITDLKGKIIDCNDTLTEITGYNKEYFVGKDFFELDIYAHGGLESLKKDYVEFLIKGHTNPSEFNIVKKNHGEIWISMVAEFITYNNERAIQAIIFDITDRKKWEEKLKELSMITEKTTDAIIKTDLKFHITYMNKAAEELFGWSFEEIRNKNPIMFNAEPDPDSIEREIYDTISSGGVYRSVLLNKKKDGSFFYNECKVSPLFNDNGEIYAYISSQRDVTERVNSIRKLKESEKKYRRIAELIPDVILEVANRGKITYANSSTFQLFGYTPGELKEEFNYLDLIAEKEKRKVKIRHKRLKEGKLNRHTEILMIKKDRTKFYSRTNCRPIYEKGNIIGIMILISDIHHSVIAKQKIKESERKLKELNELKSRLLRRTSHELKTPLISIKGFSSLLLKLESQNLNKKALEYIKEIKNGCERLEVLVNKILNASKIESNNLKIVRKKENLSKIIQIAVNSLRGASKARDHSISIDIHEEMFVMGERAKILEVIENLISNAIKYTPLEGEISINSEFTDERYIIAIKDNGIGFTAEEKKDLFIQFGKIERYGMGYDLCTEGSGLGLYISKSIIKLHGGDLWVESEGRGQGATFYFSLPKYSPSK